MDPEERPGRPASRTKRATIRDVAAAAGVSKSLVSLVYSGGRVSADRRARVLSAAERLGFRPNLTARSLAAAESDFTGILVADLHNPVFAEIVDAARAELARSGRSALLTAATTPDADGEPVLDRRALAVFGDLRPRSILIVGSALGMGELATIAPRTPIVVASAIAENLSTFATIRSDDGEGMRLVVDHLAQRGHRRIAHVGGRGGTVAERRADAYVDAMAANGLSAETRVEQADFSEQSGYAAATALLDGEDAPTAIACVNDLAAVGVLAAADDYPSAVAVTGYDNSSVAQLRRVSLTSVDPHNAEIGVQAARRILEAEEGLAAAEPETLVPPALVPRASTHATRRAGP